VCHCHVCIPSFKPCVIAMFVYLRSSVRHCHVCIPSFKPCVIAMFVYPEGIQTWQWRTAWTKVYKHGNDARLERRYTNMAITHGLNEAFVQAMRHCHVCIPSFKSCVIAMFVDLRSSRVLLPCLYTFVQAVCYCHVCRPSFKPCVIAMFVNLRSSRVLLPCLYTFVQAVCYWRYTNMAMTQDFNEGIQTWQ
jgi:hypothetical protein